MSGGALAGFPPFNGFTLKSPRRLSFAHESRSPSVAPTQQVLFYFLEPHHLVSPASGREMEGGQCTHLLSSLVWKRHITGAHRPLATWPHLDTRKAGNYSDYLTL